MATTNNHDPPHAMLEDEFPEEDDDQYGLVPATKVFPSHPPIHNHKLTPQPRPPFAFPYAP